MVTIRLEIIVVSRMENGHDQQQQQQQQQQPHHAAAR